MKLLLIDGNNLIFRAYYATSYSGIMKTSFGAYTNAVYAFANMLNKALKQIKPEYCAVAFDKGKHTFRHDLNPDYKGGRKATPAELIEQFETVRKMLKAYNIPYLEFEDIEADDIIGTLSKKFSDTKTCILSSDKDLLQLIDDTTSVYVMKKGLSDIVQMDERALYEEYGLKPAQIIDFKGLAGDSSDNIKGVEGVGEKTAIKLLQSYETVEGIYEHIDEVKGKMKEKLINGKDSAFLSKTLATIKTDVNIDMQLDDLRLDINNDTKNAFFVEYEMKSLVSNDFVSQKKLLSNEVNKISKELYDNPLIYIDSDEFSYYGRRLYGLAVSNGQICEYIKTEDLLKDEEFKQFISSDLNKIFFDLKASKHCLDQFDIRIGENSDDVFLMAFLANNDNSDLGRIIHNYGYYMSTTIKDIYGSEKKPLIPDKAKQIDRASECANFLYSIYLKALDELNEKEMRGLYYDVELPLVSVLYEMEEAGIYCDSRELQLISDNMAKKLKDTEKNIFDRVGHEFNLNSPAQLKDVLYNELELPDLKKGSTSAEVLQKLLDYDPIISDILNYRKFAKLHSSYGEGLKRYIGEDGKIHTIFQQMVAATGRLSSSEPNLQNISVRDEEGREIRRVFKPSENSLLVSCDYSQIELRVLASLSGETKMIEAFNEGIDIHDKTAMDIFHLNKEDVTPNIRRQAKAINFGVVYGISDFGLSNQTGLSFKEAKKFIDDYFVTYPNIKTYLDSQVEFCIKNGYVKTILNRRRYIPEIKDPKFMVREFGKRAAMNATIQGSAADIIKIAMVNVTKRIKEEKLKSRLILQVHDELIFDVAKDEETKMKEIILDTMSKAYNLKVKLESSYASGKDWYEAK